MSDWIFFEEHHTMKCPHCEMIYTDYIPRRFCPMCGAYMNDESWDAKWKEFIDTKVAERIKEHEKTKGIDITGCH